MIARLLGRHRRDGVAPEGPTELRAGGVRVYFQGVKAIDGVDLTLQRGEILGLIGPNGAGKTTLVNALSGFQRPTEGTVCLDERDVTGWPPNRLGRIGVARTFQAVRLFGSLSVEANIELGALGVGASRREAKALATELLEQIGLRDRAQLAASALPYGDERRLGIARSLAMRPAFLLLDEPAAGLNEEESDELVGTIGDVRRRFGCGVLVIEHDMRLIMRLCDRIQVLDHGQTLAVGLPTEVQNNQAVIEAYLGTHSGR